MSDYPTEIAKRIIAYLEEENMMPDDLDEFREELTKEIARIIEEGLA